MTVEIPLYNPAIHAEPAQHTPKEIMPAGSLMGMKQSWFVNVCLNKQLTSSTNPVLKTSRSVQSYIYMVYGPDHGGFAPLQA